MGLAIGIGNGILFTSQRGVSSIIPGLIDDLCARATYCENKLCTTATLEEIAAVRYTAPVLPTGLLADYPGASAAYSLRNLIDTTTNVVRVRRSSDNTEQDFTSTEITDGTLTTFTGANDGFVAIWYDQSVNGNNALQTTATAQPKLVSNGVIELVNGKPCLELDQYSPKKRFILNNVITGTQSTFLVHKKIGEGGTKYIYDGNAAINRNYAITVGGGFQILNKRNTYVNGSLVTSADPTVQNLLMINLLANSQDIGTLFARYTTSENYPGRVQEMIFYPSDQIANRTGIETNINTEYTIY